MKINRNFNVPKTNHSGALGRIGLKILMLVFFIVLSLVFTQLVFANNLAVDGQKLSEIENKAKKLEEENTSLKVEIARVSSLSSLSTKAGELGFVKPSKITVY